MKKKIYKIKEMFEISRRKCPIVPKKSQCIEYCILYTWMGQWDFFIFLFQTFIKYKEK